MFLKANAFRNMKVWFNSTLQDFLRKGCVSEDVDENKHYEDTPLHPCVCMYVCMCVRVYVCMCVCVCVRALVVVMYLAVKVGGVDTGLDDVEQGVHEPFTRTQLLPGLLPRRAQVPVRHTHTHTQLEANTHTHTHTHN